MDQAKFYIAVQKRLRKSLRRRRKLAPVPQELLIFSAATILNKVNPSLENPEDKIQAYLRGYG